MKISKEYVSEFDYYGADYIAILTFFLDKADSFEFVLRNDIHFGADESCTYDASAMALIEALEPFIFDVTMGQKWMASSTYYSPANIYRGKFNQASLAVILSFTNKFSDWQGPKIPDDLSLIRKNQGVLKIIGHESIGLWCLTDEEVFDLDGLNNKIELFYHL